MNTSTTWITVIFHLSYYTFHALHISSSSFFPLLVLGHTHHTISVSLFLHVFPSPSVCVSLFLSLKVKILTTHTHLLNHEPRQLRQHLNPETQNQASSIERERESGGSSEFKFDKMCETTVFKARFSNIWYIRRMTLKRLQHAITL
jgi:hypothetical protein